MANGSKYIKEKGEGSNSKYIRNKDDSSRHSGDSNPDGLSGRARYLEMLEREREMKDTLELLEDDSRAAERIAKREAAKKEAAKKAAQQRAAEGKKSSGKQASTLKVERNGEGSKVAFSSDIEAKPLANEDEDEKVFRKIWIRNIVTCTILGAIAFVLQIASFRLPLMPGMTKIDLSAIPELLAAVSFGPIAGTAIVILKNVLYILIYQGDVLATAVSNVILDSVFVFVASLIYARGMFSPMAIERRMMEDPEGLKDTRGPTIIKSGLIGAIVTTPVSYVTALYIVYPLVFRMYGSAGYNEDYYVILYNDALRALNSHLPAALSGKITDITTLSKGVMVYNMPITFAKLIFVTLFVAIAFRWLSKILFYKPNINPEDIQDMKKRQAKQQKK